MFPASSKLQQPLGLGAGLASSFVRPSIAATTTTPSTTTSIPPVSNDHGGDHGWAQHTSKDGKTFWHNIKVRGRKRETIEFSTTRHTSTVAALVVIGLMCHKTSWQYGVYITLVFELYLYWPYPIVCCCCLLRALCFCF